MAIGHDPCPDCERVPSHKLLPCGHGTCKTHYDVSDGENTVCGNCGARVLCISEIKSAPSTDPARQTNSKWSVSSALKLFNTHSSAMHPEKNEDSKRKYRNSDATTPTHAPSKNSNTAVGSQKPPPQRYVPPQLRNSELDDVRPSSSISNATFATQPPATPMDYQSSFQGGNDPAGYTRLSRYRYGPEELTPKFASLDPFVDARRLPPTGSFSNGNGTGSRNHSYVTVINTPSNQGSMHDSGAATASGVDMARAVYLANLIRSGATDDPNDIDYGNPGRSRRLPEEPQPLPSAPVPRGKVAASNSQAVISYSEAEPNTKGNAAAFLGLNKLHPPGWLAQTYRGYSPSVEEVFSMLPMIDACRVAQPTTAGVIKLTNIPYASTRPEIVAFLGRNAQILSQPEGSPYHAVHIMMDRASAKTMDAYVELKTAKEASFVANTFDRRIKNGRSAKLGDRDVAISVVSQGDLMAELFPRAKNTEWAGPIPQIDNKVEYYFEGVPSTGFQGFLQSEELVFMTKHAETPGRSPFAQRVPVRSYEHLITLLHKYPWHAEQYVLLSERHAIYDTTLRTMRVLVKFLSSTEKNQMVNRTAPTVATLQELAVAALTCPGFSEGQKAAIVHQLVEGGFKHVADGRGVNFQFGGNHKFSRHWPFHALVKQPGVRDDVVEYVASLFRKSTSGKQKLSLADAHAMNPAGVGLPMFGLLNVEYKNVKSFADLARAEFRAIEEALAYILPRSRSMSSRTGSYLS